MTKQFGARLFQVLQEELDTLNWFEQGGSKTCPRCDARIEVSSLLHGWESFIVRIRWLCFLAFFRKPRRYKYLKRFLFASRVFFQKDGGCNKMHCARCQVNFCWLCHQVLGNDPYEHYSNPQSPCTGLLFEPWSVSRSLLLPSPSRPSWATFNSRRAKRRDYLDRWWSSIV